MRSDGGNRTYIITARRMISGEVLDYLNGERWVMPRGEATSLPTSREVPLRKPDEELRPHPAPHKNFALTVHSRDTTYGRMKDQWLVMHAMILPRSLTNLKIV